MARKQAANACTPCTAPTLTHTQLLTCDQRSHAPTCAAARLGPLSCLFAIWRVLGFRWRRD
eukprot:4272654-Alexandrium_andersonii.AAC.1